MKISEKYETKTKRLALCFSENEKESYYGSNVLTNFWRGTVHGISMFQPFFTDNFQYVFIVLFLLTHP